MPIVRVEIAKGVASVDQKKAVIRRMTDVLVEELSRNPEYVFVVIDEVDTDNWGRKGLSLTDLWQQQRPKDFRLMSAGWRAVRRARVRFQTETLPKGQPCARGHGKARRRVAGSPALRGACRNQLALEPAASTGK